MGMERICHRTLVRIVVYCVMLAPASCVVSNPENSTRTDPDSILEGSCGTYSVLLLEFLGDGGAEDDTALAGGGLEVCLARLAPRRGDTWRHHQY